MEGGNPPTDGVAPVSKEEAAPVEVKAEEESKVSKK